MAAVEKKYVDKVPQNEVSMMIEIANVEQKEVTDQEAAEAINTIKRYCDCRYCCDCVIRKVCQEYFDNGDAYPDDWPDLCAD